MVLVEDVLVVCKVYDVLYGEEVGGVVFLFD